jgi:phosphatidate cytidylyltransferase
MTNLQVRIVAALIYFPFVLLCTWSEWSFAVLMAIFSAVAWYEYTHFFEKFRGSPWHLEALGWAGLGSLPLVFYALEIRIEISIVILLLLWQAAALWSLFKGRGFVEFLNNTQLIGFGFVYITALYICLVSIHRLEGGIEAIWFLLFVVGAADSGAYFAGKSFGQTPFFQFVSPSKTREGFWGGLIFGLAVALLINFVLLSFDYHGVAFWKAALLGVFISTLSSFGDLVESSIKRSFGVKDSGRIIVGHGGILDRFDGVIYAGPILLLFMYLNEGFVR